MDKRDEKDWTVHDMLKMVAARQAALDREAMYVQLKKMEDKAADIEREMLATKRK